MVTTFENQDQTITLTTQQVAKMLGTTVRRINQLISQGHIPAVDVSMGSATHPIWRIRPEAVDRFLTPASQN